jgi:hypothetical protein
MTTSTKCLINVEVDVLFNVRLTKIPVHSWEFPSSPWQRVHIYYAEPFIDTNFLMIVDVFTKWPEIVATKQTDSSSTIRILRDTFARFGFPVTMVSDNGPQFRSNEMEHYILQRIIESRINLQHLTTLHITGKLSVLCKCSRMNYAVCIRTSMVT